MEEKNILTKIIISLAIISLILIIINVIQVYRHKIKISTYNITILGDNPMVLYQGDKYVESGYVAHDYQNKERNKMVKVTNNVNGDVIGTYKVIYEISNFFKKNRVVREVNVVENPLEEVVFSLKGDSVVNLERNNKYQEKGFNVISDKGDFTNNVEILNNVDVSKVGVYEIVYTLKIGNKEKSIKRVVNVLGDKYTVSIDNNEWTNQDVKITIESHLKDFDYFINPNNIKVKDEVFEFTVDKNDNYVFHLVDKYGIDEQITVNITNIDKDKPLGTCNSFISQNKTTYKINVTDASGILKYTHNDTDYEINNFVINKIEDVGNVIVYDNAGNFNELSCTVEYEYIGPNTKNYIYKYESNTLKYWIESFDYYKTTHIWVKDAYNQMKVAIPSNIGSLYTARTLLNNEIKNKSYEEKGMVAINASGIVGGGFGKNFLNMKPSWVGTTAIPFVLNNGKVIRDSTNQETPNVYFATYGMKKDGYLGYYKYGLGTDIEYSKSIKEKILNDGIKDTFAFYPVLVYNGKAKSDKKEKDIRQSLCQIDRNNFVIITNTVGTNNRSKGFNYDELSKYMVKLNCKIGFNLDGGGSTNHYYKGNNKNIYSIKNSSRGLVDLLYFVEK